jgi:hypothetical protein
MTMFDDFLSPLDYLGNKKKAPSKRTPPSRAFVRVTPA